MPFCPNCGKDLTSDLKFCPNCGAPQSTPTAQVGNPQVVVVEKRTLRRPGGVSLLIIFDLIAGFVLLGLGVVFSLLSPTIGGFIGAVGLFTLVIVYGWSRAESWVRFPGLAQGVVLVLLGGIFGTSQSEVGYVIGIPLILLGVWTVYLLTRTRIVTYLKTGEIPPSS